MSFLKESDGKLDPQTQGMYKFFEDHRDGWQGFWQDMGGDHEKIVAWAEDAGIESPIDWFTGLHSFLFDHYSGDYRLLYHSAAKNNKSFGSFLGAVIQQHIKEPKDRWWYINQGMTLDKYIAILERAADIEDPIQAATFLDARVPNMGHQLYDEYLLSLTGWQAKQKQAAARLVKQAHEIESNIFVKTFSKGDRVVHYTNPMVKYKVVGNVDGTYVLKNKRTGAISCTDETWCLEKQAQLGPEYSFSLPEFSGESHFFELLTLASHFYDGQGDPLYAVQSRGDNEGISLEELYALERLLEEIQAGKYQDAYESEEEAMNDERVAYDWSPTIQGLIAEAPEGE